MADALNVASIQAALQAVLDDDSIQHPSLAIAICDQAGDLLYLRRDRDAPGFAADFAAAKAYTAARFNNSTSALEAAWADRPVFAASMMAQGKWFIGRGGEPIRRQDQAIGGVGASGNTPAAEELIARSIAEILSD